MRIQGSVVIVTGASSGIGAATARLLARRGATVVLAARRKGEIHAIAGEIEQAGGRALAVPTDVTSRIEIDRLVERTVDAYKRVDALVNNAGTGGGGTIADSDEQMRQVLEVNLLAPGRLVQAALPHLRRQGGGIIVNIGSVAGEVGVSGMYSASKFGLRGLNDALRRELRADNIQVVLIEPGFIRTGMTAGLRLPIPGPAVVARAVAAAIERPRRTVVVPWYYMPPILLVKLFPGLADRIIGSKQAQRRYREREHTR